MTERFLRTPSRRDFLRAGATAGLATAFPMILPARARGAAERVSLGFIGLRNQGAPNLRAFQKHTDVAVTMLCDVDKNVLGAAHEIVTKSSGGEVATTGDYRKILERKDIDGVVITTPDHWHALMTIDACNAGKDVYCEKPLSLTIHEGQLMTAVARKTKRVVQTGSQQRSEARFRQAAELVRNGYLGKMKLITLGLPAVNFDGPAVPDTTPPPELDYEFWLGPAPQKPYNPKHVHYLFRFFWDYSGGQMTNFGAHQMDIVQWALGRDESGPTKIEAVSKTYQPEHWYEVPMTSEIHFTYDDGTPVVCKQGMGLKWAITFEGEKGTLRINRGQSETDPPELLKTELRESDVHLEASDDHHRNWLDCIRSRKNPIADVSIGHRSSSIAHLANISIRTGRPLKWDPVKEVILDDSEASQMLRRAHRAPWTLPEA